MSNPLRDTYDAIHAALLTNADILALFLGGSANTVSHVPNMNPAGKTYAPDPRLDAPKPADYPLAELVFKPERRYWRGPAQEMQDTSDSSTLRVQYAVEALTGHQIQGRLMDACWALWTFSSNWQATLGGVLYNDNPCVLYAEPCEMDVNFAEAMRQKEESRATNQWILLWALNVGFVFKTHDLQTAG